MRQKIAELSAKSGTQGTKIVGEPCLFTVVPLLQKGNRQFTKTPHYCTCDWVMIYPILVMELTYSLFHLYMRPIKIIVSQKKS